MMSACVSMIIYVCSYMYMYVHVCIVCLYLKLMSRFCFYLCIYIKNLYNNRYQGEIYKYTTIQLYIDFICLYV